MIMAPRGVFPYDMLGACLWKRQSTPNFEGQNLPTAAPESQDGVNLVAQFFGLFHLQLLCKSFVFQFVASLAFEKHFFRLQQLSSKFGVLFKLPQSSLRSRCSSKHQSLCRHCFTKNREHTSSVARSSAMNAASSSRANAASASAAAAAWRKARSAAAALSFNFNIQCC